MRKVSEKSLITNLSQLPFNQFLYTIDEARKQQSAKLDRFIADAIAGDIQQHLDQYDYQISCPICSSTSVRKNGKRGNLQRYKCKDCGHRFSSTSNTILEKTYYSWDVWIAIIQSMINGLSIEKTRQLLEDDYKCTTIRNNTIWQMRMKIMNAVSKLPAPILHGVIQFDETYLREDQKASRHLVSPFPDDFNYVRGPRKGETPSLLGVRGNEYVSITCAVDNIGHTVCRILGCGVIPEDVMYDFITEYTDGMAFACTDADKTYKSVFKAMKIPHYVKPSNYLKTITHAGYIQPSQVEKTISIEQIKKNDVILEKLWNEKKIDNIFNRGTLGYNEFNEMKRANNLSLGRVNELHSELKLMLEKQTAGVSSKFLPFYLAWFEYLHNKKIDCAKSLSSKAMAEEILLDVLNTHANISKEELAIIGQEPLSFPKASDHYMKLLDENTKHMQEYTKNKWFVFTDEDGFNQFHVREIMREMPHTKLKELGKKYHIKYWGKISKTNLISQLEKQDGIDKAIFEVMQEQQEHEEMKKQKSAERKANKHSNKTVNRATFTSRMFSNTITNADNKNVVFIDTETTGLNKQYDEVLSLAIVNLNGEVLYDGLFKPQHKKNWKEAQAVNGISPRKVAKSPSIVDEKEKIEAILNSADMICGWNVRFDLNFLYAGGIELPRNNDNYIDLMPLFADTWTDWGKVQKHGYKVSLANASKLLKLKYKSHTALGDSAVLIKIWKWLCSQQKIA